jgi:uncharacterized lipoprotein YmbA
MNAAILPLVAVLLAGCATSQAATDTYCLSARKIIWSIEDSPETIQKAETINRTIDRRCGVPGKSSR